MKTSIALRNIQILADVGVYRHEIGRPQPLILHVALAVVTPDRDSVEAVFDYASLKGVAEALGLKRIVLIETFARRVAETCLEHRLVRGAVVTVEKPQGVPGAMASATVTIGDPI